MSHASVLLHPASSRRGTALAFTRKGMSALQGDWLWPRWPACSPAREKVQAESGAGRGARPPPFQHRRPPLAETSLTLDLCPPPKATVFARRQPTTPVGSVFQSRVLAGPWWSRETLPEPGRGSARPTQGHPGSPPAELCPPLVTLSPKGQSGRRGDNVPVTGRAFGFTAKKKTKTRYSVSSW